MEKNIYCRASKFSVKVFNIIYKSGDLYMNIMYKSGSKYFLSILFVGFEFSKDKNLLCINIYLRRE